ncbi:MAG: imidazoleglycerol-phosphate dehydratase [Candidatus Omnitrophica bacterium CG11_big_fil_rev_8_21_14_0_20_42_13]|uniref:Imidazoleglycerol-phosphate dehydratase n=1 Tax=Candidatus Ghiorseimicrobium undicola TaxID=1974746 RepID=A0A2H0LVF9_9BACT|nr:MAG: imidazoleglycerol-phosphate dehydratase [Candidatus Omnitrophica bacterium CG11_big_fil_rev_8_21_14_0_20_42_13]
MKREALIERITNEVNIKGSLALDGKGKSKINTGFESLDHLLTLFSFHGFFDLELAAKGDLQHHIVEDLSIVLGKAFRKALGDSSGIKRYGYASVPMDEILARVSVDLGGRYSFVWDEPAEVKKINENLDLASDELKKEFLDNLAKNIGMNLYVEYLSKEGEVDTHHLFEAVFKALGLALDQASSIEARRRGVPSTKGIID